MPHEIDYLLECRHINVKPVEAAIFVSETVKVDDQTTCTVCGKVVKIMRVGIPYWIDDEPIPVMPEKSKP